MDRLDCADVDALRWLLGDDDARVARQLARELHLLLIAAGERSRRLSGSAPRTSNLPISSAALRRAAPTAKNGPRRNSPRWPSVRFSQTLLVSDRPTRAAVRRNIGEAGVATAPARRASERLPADRSPRPAPARASRRCTRRVRPDRCPARRRARRSRPRGRRSDRSSTAVSPRSPMAVRPSTSRSLSLDGCAFDLVDPQQHRAADHQARAISCAVTPSFVDRWR